MKTCSLIFSIFFITACSQQSIYHAMQNNGRMACQNEQPATQRECQQQYDTSYKDYRREIAPSSE